MRKKILAIVFGFVLAFSTSASASIILDNWTIDLTGVDGGVQYVDVSDPLNPTLQPLVVTGVSEITYVGMAHTQQLSESYSVVDGLLSATTLLSGGTNISNTSLGDTWEMTFDFSVNNLTTPTATGATFTHLAYDTPAPAGFETVWADGFLDVYVDSFLNTFEVADFTTGTGYRDGADGGVLIARFGVDAGSGGIYTEATFDGSDDASFSLIGAAPGVFIHPLYGDLSQYTVGQLQILFALTDSNLDGDPLTKIADGYDIGVDYYFDLSGKDPVTGIVNPANSTWPFLFNGAGSAKSAFLKEDGSVSIGIEVIPEPSTFLLLGAGLLGLGIIGRKKMRK